VEPVEGKRAMKNGKGVPTGPCNEPNAKGVLQSSNKRGGNGVDNTGGFTSLATARSARDELNKGFWRSRKRNATEKESAVNAGNLIRNKK